MTSALEVGVVTVGMRTDLAGLDRGLAEAHEHVSKATKQMEDTAESSLSSWGSVLVGALQGAAVGQLLDTMGTLVKMGQQAQVQEARLRQSVISTGASWNDYAKVLERVIAARRVFAFTDSQQQAALSLLIQMTGSVEEAINREGLAMDLARAKNIDLVTAATYLGKVNSEQVAILKRLGITLGDNATEEEALAAVHAQTSDQALAYSRLDIAATERRENAWNNTKEAIGQGISGLLGPFANLSTSVQGFGLEFGTAGGALLKFAKAGQGSIPVLTGLKGAIFGIGGALKALFLNPVGLAILAVAAFVVGLKLLYDHVEPVRNALNALGQTLLRIVPGLQWVMDRLGDVGKALGIVSDDAGDMGDAFTAGATKAKQGIRSIGDEIKDLSDMLKPAGADETEAFLKAIGADQTTIDAALDALYNEVGADSATRLKKLTDRAYKDLVDKFKQSDAYKEAYDNLTEALDMSEEEFAKASAQRGKTPAAYMAELKKNAQDADGLLEHYSKTLAGAIQHAKDINQADLDAGSRISSHLRSINQIADAWDNARMASGYYYSGVLAGGTVAPKFGPGAPRDTPPFEGGIDRSSGGANDNAHLASVVVNQNLNYTGDSVAMASDAASQVIDAVTEAFRQGDRRLAGGAVA